MTKHIWLPTTETTATVDKDGNVNVWDTMKMELKPISAPKGFEKPGTSKK